MDSIQLRRQPVDPLRLSGSGFDSPADFATCVEVFGKALAIKADDAEVQEALAFAKRQLA